MTYIYKSGLKSYILGLITQKRADGIRKIFHTKVSNFSGNLITFVWNIFLMPEQLPMTLPPDGPQPGLLKEMATITGGFLH